MNLESARLALDLRSGSGNLLGLEQTFRMSGAMAASRVSPYSSSFSQI